MKHQFHLAAFFSMALSMALSVSIMVACGKGSASSKEQVASENNTEAITETVGQTAEDNMKAPAITPDENGLIRLSQCPTTYDKLEIAITEDFTSATISYDGKQIQTLSDPDDGLVATGDDAPIHFMDANFDGFVDIFIGPGESRTYSTLLIWDATAKEFKRVGKLGEPSYQNIMLFPSKKYVFEGGSSSWCSNFFTRSIWDKGNLKKIEELCIVSDAEQYGEYQVKNKYTLRDDQQNDILSTDDMTALPAPWKSVIEDF